MAEKRLFHVKVMNLADGKFLDYEAFYEAHTVRSVRKDAELYYRDGPHYCGQVLDARHENLTKNPTEFYKRLREAESRGKVVPTRLKGIGQRWTVEPKDVDDASIPFGFAADNNNGGVPPSLMAVPGNHPAPEDDEDDDAAYERAMTEEDEPHPHEVTMHYHRNEAARIYASGQDKEPVADTGKLPQPEDADQTLDELRRDPSTYPLVNEIEVGEPQPPVHLHSDIHDSYLNY